MPVTLPRVEPKDLIGTHQIKERRCAMSGKIKLVMAAVLLAFTLSLGAPTLVMPQDLCYSTACG